MSKKLFAMEDLEGGVTEAELQVSPEEGEVADVQVEVEQEVAEVAEDTTSIEEGMEAADQLEQVEEVVEKAVEGEGEGEGAGLDPVAAEAIKIAVEAICARVGANPKAMYALYATENFQSASSRKANTKIALEGVGEFLKDLWKKIKAALERLVAKAKDFWNKYFSALGRTKKALESMKQKVSDSSGKLKDKAYVEEAPASLVEAFAGDKDITSGTVEGFITAHEGLSAEADKLGGVVKTINDAVTAGKKADSVKDVTISFGSEKAPLVGGSFTTYTFELDKEEGDLSVESDRGSISNKESKLGISISEKAQVQALLKKTIDLINATSKRKDSAEKKQAEVSKMLLALEKAVNASDRSDEEMKATRKLMKVAYKVNAKTAGVDSEVFALNIKLAKAVLGYAGFCVKNYK